MKRSKIRDFIEFELRDLLGEVLDADIPGNRYDLASDRADKILEMIEDEGILTDKWEDEIPKMSSSERVVSLRSIKPLSSDIAGRMQMIHGLIDTNVYDDDGNIIGQKEPMITSEKARELLGFASKDFKSND